MFPGVKADKRSVVSKKKKKKKSRFSPVIKRETFQAQTCLRHDPPYAQE